MCVPGVCCVVLFVVCLMSCIVSCVSGVPGVRGVWLSTACVRVCKRVREVSPSVACVFFAE